MNTYRYTLILVIACLYPATLFAQREHDFELDTNYHIGQQNQYKSLKVVDLRENKGNVGTFGRNTDLVTDKPLGDLLTSHFNAITKDHKGSDELVLVLYHFLIEDRPIGEQVGTFYFDGDFYDHNNGQYSFIGKIDSLYEVISNMDVSRALMKMVQAQVNEVFSRFAKADIKTMDVPVYTETQLPDRRKQQNLNYPIYRAAGNFKKGIYYTIGQFINNTPVDTPFIKTRYQINAERKGNVLFYLNKKGNKGKMVMGETYFAAYDGTDWMLGTDTDSECIPLEYKDGEFYATVPLHDVNRLNAMKISPVVADAMPGMGNGVFVGVRLHSKKSRSLPVKGSGTYKARFDPTIKGFRPIKRII